MHFLRLLNPELKLGADDFIQLVLSILFGWFSYGKTNKHCVTNMVCRY